MTRMAPTSRALRATHTEAEREAEVAFSARWRVGLRGRLVVALSSDPDTNGLLGTVGLTDPGAGPREGTYALRAMVSRVQDEICIEVTESSEARLAGVRCTLIGSTDPRTPLLLTDLPVVLGLRGGTYVLEHVHAVLD